MQFCESLWFFLDEESYVTINLGFYLLYCVDVDFWCCYNLGTETQRPGHRFQNCRSISNSLPQGTLKDKHTPKSSHVYMESNLHTQTSKFSTREPRAILQQIRKNNTEYYKRWCTKPYITHKQPKGQSSTIHFTLEKRDTDLPASAQTQIPRSIKHWQVTGLISCTKGRIHNTVEL